MPDDVCSRINDADNKCTKRTGTDSCITCATTPRYQRVSCSSASSVFSRVAICADIHVYNDSKSTIVHTCACVAVRQQPNVASEGETSTLRWSCCVFRDKRLLLAVYFKT